MDDVTVLRCALQDVVNGMTGLDPYGRWQLSAYIERGQAALRRFADRDGDLPASQGEVALTGQNAPHV